MTSTPQNNSNKLNIRNVDIQAMLQAIRNGSDLNTASHWAGLSNIEVFTWLEKGKQAQAINSKKPEDAFYIELWKELTKARADAIVRNVTHIQKAAQTGDWKAAAWWLERTIPETYGKNPTQKQKEIEE